MELLFGRPVVLLKNEDTCEEERMEESWDNVLAVGVLGVESINEEENAIYEEIEKRLVEKRDLDVEFMERIRKSTGKGGLKENYEAKEEIGKKIGKKLPILINMINDEGIRNLTNSSSEHEKENRTFVNLEILAGRKTMENNKFDKKGNETNTNDSQANFNRSFANILTNSSNSNISNVSSKTLEYNKMPYELKANIPTPFTSFPSNSLNESNFTNVSPFLFDTKKIPDPSYPANLTSLMHSPSLFDGQMPNETPEIIRSPNLPFQMTSSNEILENQNNISNLLEKTTPTMQSFETPEKPPVYRHKSRLSRTKNTENNEANFESPTIIRKTPNHLTHIPSVQENYRTNKPVLKPVSHMSANANRLSFNHPDRIRLAREEIENGKEDGDGEIKKKTDPFDLNKKRGYFSRFKNKGTIH